MSQFIFPPLTASLDSEQTSGGALPSRQMIVGGYHAGGSKVYPLAVDADGQLQVDVVSSMPLPSGAATSALQTAGNNILTTIDADTSSLAGAVSGSELQVDVVASLPAGSNNIGDVDVLSSALPTGAATSALQTTANGILTTIDADTGSLAGCVTGTELQVDIVSGSVTVVNSMTPIDFLTAGVVDASTLSGNIPSTGSSVLVTLAADCKEIEVIDDIGEYMSLRVGGAVKAYLPLGGGRVKCHLSTGDAVTLYSETGTTISSGKIAMNFLA